MVFVGSFFLRVIATRPAYSALPGSDQRSGSDASTVLKRTKSADGKYSIDGSSQEPGTQPDNISYSDGPTQHSVGSNGPEGPNPSMEETSSLLSKSDGSGPGDIPYQNGQDKGNADQDSHHVDIRGLALLSKMKFYQLWRLLGLLTVIGLMTIKYVLCKFNVN